MPRYLFQQPFPAWQQRNQHASAVIAAGGRPEVVVVNPGCVVGAGDFSGSEFGTRL